MLVYTKPKQRKKVKGQEGRGIRSSLSILDSKEGKFQDSGKEEGKTSHEMHVLGMNDDLWDTVIGLGSESWKRRG